MQMGVLDKAKQLLSKLVEPHPSIQDMRKRQQSRLLSSLLLLAIPIFAFTQFTNELVIFGTPIFLGGLALAFIMYLGTRTSYYDVVLTISLAAITVLPIIAFLFGANWQPNDLPRLTIWIFVAVARNLDNHRHQSLGLRFGSCFIEVCFADPGESAISLTSSPQAFSVSDQLAATRFSAAFRSLSIFSPHCSQ